MFIHGVKVEKSQRFHVTQLEHILYVEPELAMRLLKPQIFDKFSLLKSVKYDFEISFVEIEKSEVRDDYGKFLANLSNRLNKSEILANFG